MTILVTGAAGFIGFHVARALLARGEKVFGIDNLNDYYDVDLKHRRLLSLRESPDFTFEKIDIADHGTMEKLPARLPDLDRVVHLAAQAGVRYSLVNPYAYVRSNVDGHLTVLEMCKRIEGLKHLVYASSSSVYGGNTKLPFAVEDRVDRPVSIYAATKKSVELMSHAYSHLFGIPQSGLRFFTVYGPWGRPDMAAFIFTRRILADQPIQVFNNGKMRRDFTYIDDIVAGVLGCLDHPPVATADGGPPNRVYNLGNHRSETLLDFIAVIERALGKKAILDPQPMQPGDVPETFADIGPAERDFGFQPKTRIDEGIPRFIQWYKEHYRPNG